MATETKIGLIVGLGFIICFAMILDNHGREASVPEGWRRANTEASASMATPSQRRNDPSMSPARRRSPAPDSVSKATLPPSGKVRPLRRVDVDSAAGERRAQGGSRRGGSLRGRPSTRPRQAETHAARPDGSRPTGVGVEQRPSKVLNAASENARGSEDTKSDPNRRALEQLLRRRGGGDPQDAGGVRGAAQETGRNLNNQEQKRRLTPVPALNDPHKNLGSVRAHVVAAGDTLSRIAKEHYGTRSPKVIRAIFEANRNKMPNPDTLRVGLKLVLPAMDGRRASVSSQREPEAVAEPRKHRATEAVTPDPRPFRWYQVEKNDRYVTIARNELGNGQRWREIYELNRDRFPDPQRIRWGVRIKLPIAQVARAGR